MGTTLTGTTPQDTYDSLIKVTDNGPLSGTLKKLTDGLGNDSSLSLSTTAASFSGNIDALGSLNGFAGATQNLLIDWSSSSQMTTLTNTELFFGTNAQRRLTITSAGNVGIGTSSPAQRLDISNGAIKFDRITTGALTCNDAQGLIYSLINNIGSIDGLRYTSRTHRFVSHADVSYATIDADGLKFGSDTAAANALDDYEEGTWTMGVSFGGASVGVIYNNTTGTYTKIGRQVTVNGYLYLSSKGSSTGDAKITGLPFTIPNSVANYATASIWLGQTSFANQYQGVGAIGTTTIELQEATEAGVVSALTDANFANNSGVIISLTYFV